MCVSWERGSRLISARALSRSRRVIAKIEARALEKGGVCALVHVMAVLVTGTTGRPKSNSMIRID